MKRTFICILILFVSMTSAQVLGQDTYEIIRIYNSEFITIGNNRKKVGDTFKNTDPISFASSNVSLLAQRKGTSKTYYFNKAAMDAKKAKTLKDYFNNDYAKVKGSARGNNGNCPEIDPGEYDKKRYPEKRIALVIGNSNYEHMDDLPNAINDVRDVSTRLNQLGFDVMTLYDGNKNDMQTSISSFFSQAQRYQVALLYFAGHGIREKEKDYILSIDYNNNNTEKECSLDYLVAESERWKNDNNLMILVIDACRDKQGFDYTNVERSIEAKKGTVILQSTTSGEVALDANEEGGNSPFAAAFIEGVGKTGNNIENEFFSIRRYVRIITDDRQVPRVSPGGGYDFCFCRGCGNSEATNYNFPNRNTVSGNSSTWNAFDGGGWSHWEKNTYWGVSYNYSKTFPVSLSVHLRRSYYFLGMDVGFATTNAFLENAHPDSLFNTTLYGGNEDTLSISIHHVGIKPEGFFAIRPGLNMNYITLSCSFGLLWGYWIGQDMYSYSNWKPSENQESEIELCMLVNPNVVLHLPMPNANDKVHLTASVGYNFVFFDDGRYSDVTSQANGFRLGIGAEFKITPKKH